MDNVDEYLEQIPMWASKKNSLNAIREFLKEMGSPEEAMSIIHVAGTNGKGSVCAYLASILGQAGFQTAAFVSPHLEHARERFLFQGQPVGEALYQEAFAYTRRLWERMAGRGYAPPTYFEFLFYMFMFMSRQSGPDFVILETGLGGRLDTTNVIRRPILTVLTSISMDHTQYLGDTLEEIAAEKAGILKAGVPVVYDAACPETRKVIERQAESLESPGFPVGQGDYNLLWWDGEGARVTIKTLDWGELEMTIPSQAEYQMMNAAVAARAANVLYRRRLQGDSLAGRIAPGHIVEGIRQSFWPGRMEQVLPGVYLDGAHNPGGAQALNRTMKRMQQESGKPVSILFGAASDKAHRQMIQKLCDSLELAQVVVAQMDTKRSAGAWELAREFEEMSSCPVAVFPTVSQAWRHFLEVKGQGLGFCAGSLYLAGEVKALLKEGQDDRF